MLQLVLQETSEPLKWLNIQSLLLSTHMCTCPTWLLYPLLSMRDSGYIGFKILSIVFCGSDMAHYACAGKFKACCDLAFLDHYTCTPILARCWNFLVSAPKYQGTCSAGNINCGRTLSKACAEKQHMDQSALVQFCTLGLELEARREPRLIAADWLKTIGTCPEVQEQYKERLQLSYRWQCSIARISQWTDMQSQLDVKTQQHAMPPWYSQDMQSVP